MVISLVENNFIYIFIYYIVKNIIHEVFIDKGASGIQSPSPQH